MSENVNHSIEEVLELAKKKNRRADLKLIRRAYDFAKSKHGDQLRKSGEPYIIHPVQVAYILADLGLDESTICAALLHDVIEDTDVTLQDLSKEFSPEIAEMVDGVTKLGKLNYTSEQKFKKIVSVLLLFILLPILFVSATILVDSYVHPDEVPSFWGWKPFIVLSGSMETQISPGDAVIVKETGAENLKKGDIIAFKDGDVVITHRISEKFEENGQIQIEVNPNY